jgi:gamma-glutamylcyclotransferase (GGCT)/AIG2-like uncharacterized protein YtfP
MICDLIFVYGTLRRFSGAEMQPVFAQAADFVSEATYRGRLFLIDEYPGAIPSDDPTDVIHGELYRMRQPESLLNQLDQYEQCGACFPSPQEYVRRIQSVALPDNTSCQAWIYLYNRPAGGLTRIASGDFRTMPTRRWSTDAIGH